MTDNDNTPFIRPLGHGAERITGVSSTDATEMSYDEVRQLVHELQIRQRELETQNEELRTALAASTHVEPAEQLQQSELRYRRLIAAVTDYVYRVQVENGQPVKTIHRPNCESVTGYTVDEFDTNSLLWMAMVPEQDRATVQQQIAQVLSGQPVDPIEHRILRKDGRTCWVLNTVSPQYDSQGRLLAYDGLVRDISKRKQFESQLNELNSTLEQRVADQIQEVRLLAEAMANLGEGVMLTSARLDWPDPKIAYVNDAMLKITGYAAEELIGQSPRMLQGERSDGETLKRLRQALGDGTSHRCEVINYRKGGTAYDAEIFVTPLCDADGELTNFIGIHRDISDRKRMERELRDSQEQFLLFVNNSPTAAWIKDEAGRYVFLSNGYLNQFGVIVGDYLGKTDVDIWPPDIAQEFRRNDLITLESGQVQEVVEEALNNDGSTCTWWSFKFPFTNSAGQRFVGGMGMDITERQRVDRELQRQHQLTENMFNTVQSIILLLDTDGRVVYFNPYTAKLTGWGLDEVVGQSWFDRFLKGNDHPNIAQLFRQAKDGRRTRGYVNLILTKDGDEREIEWYDAKLMDADGQFIGLLCAGQDVTENRNLARHVLHAANEEQRRIGQDLHDSVGQEVSGLAMMADALARSMRESAKKVSAAKACGVNDLPECEAILRIAEDLATGLQSALQQVKAVARGLHPVEVDPQGLHSALHELARHAGTLYDIACDFRGDKAVTVSNKDAATHLYRIAQEAVTNAVTHGRAGRVNISLAATDDTITLEIRDNGSGMPADAAGQGGMGLRSMNYRAGLIGGRLSIVPGDGSGTLVSCECAKYTSTGSPHDSHRHHR